MEDPAGVIRVVVSGAQRPRQGSLLPLLRRGVGVVLGQAVVHGGLRARCRVHLGHWLGRRWCRCRCRSSHGCVALLLLDDRLHNLQPLACHWLPVLLRSSVAAAATIRRGRSCSSREDADQVGGEGDGHYRECQRDELQRVAGVEPPNPGRSSLAVSLRQRQIRWRWWIWLTLAAMPGLLAAHHGGPRPPHSTSISSAISWRRRCCVSQEGLHRGLLCQPVPAEQAAVLPLLTLLTLRGVPLRALHAAGRPRRSRVHRRYYVVLQYLGII